METSLRPTHGKQLSKTNAEILDDLLTQWENLGYRFGTLEELFV